MEIIFVSKCRGRLGRLRFHWLAVFFIAAVLLGGAASTLYVGYRLGAEHTREQIVSLFRAQSSQAWQRELMAQRRSISDARASLNRDVDALALRLGQLTARIVRLDALGERLAEIAKLDPTEFNFGEAPPLGGPQPPQEQSSTDLQEIAAGMEDALARLSDREDKLNALEDLLMSRKLQGASYPAGRPIVSGWVSSGFGDRTDPMSGKKEFHRGVDFAGKRGSDVIAVASGVVTWSDRRYGHGNMVEINHGNGYVTRYSHNLENLVAVGDKVEKDQVIAKMGSTGRSTGPHVHFEVLHHGKIINPKRFILSANRQAP